VETLVDILEDNFDLARRYLAALAQGLIAIIGVRYQRGKDLGRAGLAPGFEVAESSLGVERPPV